MKINALKFKGKTVDDFKKERDEFIEKYVEKPKYAVMARSQYFHLRYASYEITKKKGHLEEVFGTKIIIFEDGKGERA